MMAKDWMKIAIGGAFFAIVAQVVHTASAAFTMGWYTDPAYFGLWSKIMMPAAGPPGAEFFIASLLANFAIGAIYSGAYSMLGKALPGKGVMKGLKYGALIFMLAVVPFTLTAYVLLAIPSALLLDWAVSDLVNLLLLGAALTSLFRD